jgi:outer membrane murein-binding lipoprotein Lpp
MTGAKGHAPFALDDTVQVEDQVAQLADYVRKLKNEIARLDREVEQVRTQASAAVSQALADAKDDAREQNQSLLSQIDAAQVLDLKWASGGLAITAIGILLSYCS